MVAGGDLGIAEPISSENPCAADSWSGDSAHTRIARATDSRNWRICPTGLVSVMFDNDKYLELVGAGRVDIVSLLSGMSYL